MALVAACAIPGFGHADETPDPRVHIAVTRVSPSEGVTVEIDRPAVAHLAPLLTLRNRSGKTIEIDGPDGVPMLRVGPDGVEGNARSPHLGPAVRPNDPPPPSPGGPEPLWQPRSGGDTVKWYDRRAAYEGHGPDDRAKPATLRLFTIPGRIDGDTFAIEGSITWRPRRGHVEAALTAVTPDVDGVRVRVIPGRVPGIELRNDSARTIEITGRDGKPFARVGPAGIEVDEDSPTWRDTRSRPEASPRTTTWRAQSSRVLIWLERRAAFDGEPSAADQAAATVRILSRWTVPGTIDGAPFAIRGVTRWIPAPVAPQPQPPAGTPWWPFAVAVAVLAGGGALWLARRRRPA